MDAKPITHKVGDVTVEDWTASENMRRLIRVLAQENHQARSSDMDNDHYGYTFSKCPAPLCVKAREKAGQ